MRNFIRRHHLLSALLLVIATLTFAICSCLVLIIVLPTNSGGDERASQLEQLELQSVEPVATATDLTPTVDPLTELAADLDGDIAIVNRIIDGDTIEVLLAGEPARVRYIGIDTPEQGEPGGDEATAFNTELVAGQQVILVRDVSETDRYGRLLRYVYLADGTFVNEVLVTAGYAVAATFPPDVAYAENFQAWEATARDAGNGLWSPASQEAAETVVEVPVTEASATLAPLVAASSTATASPSPTAIPSRTATNLPTIVPTSTPLPPTIAAPLATATPLPPATATQAPQPTATEPPPAAPSLIINYIYYDGQVANVESDEYIELINNGTVVVNLRGYRINADDQGQDYTFDIDLNLAPGQTCRIYTNQDHPEHCQGFAASFHNGRAIWANDGECGHLFDPSGAEVSTWCY